MSKLKKILIKDKLKMAKKKVLAPILLVIKISISVIGKMIK